MNQHMQNAQIDLVPGDESLNAIVVGTGRSGSTMLSNLFREHPAIISLSEFFRLLHPMALGGGVGEVVDAAQFWEIIGTPATHLSFFLQQEIPMPEFLYPFKSLSSRFTGATGVPPILLVALPHLTSDYEALYDEIRLIVQDFPPDRLEIQFARLFRWLKQRFGCSTYIERSGHSLTIASSLVQMFPRTKFVHLVRDGRSCAWSMSRHFAFRFMIAMEMPVAGLTPDNTTDEDDGEDNDGNKGQPASNQTGIEQIASLPIPLANFGRFWSRLIIMGVQVLMTLPEEQVLTIRYENIITDPRRNLTRLIDFIDPSLQNASWLDRACTLIEERPSDWTRLPAGELAALARACQPGQAVLALVFQEGMHSARLPALLYDLANASARDF